MSEKYIKARIQIGHKIKELRELKGLSLRTMANDLNMDPTQYSRLEKGQTFMRLDSLLRIAEHHKIPFDYFFSQINFSEKM